MAVFLRFTVNILLDFYLEFSMRFSNISGLGCFREIRELGPRLEPKVLEIRHMWGSPSPQPRNGPSHFGSRETPQCEPEYLQQQGEPAAGRTDRLAPAASLISTSPSF